MKYFGKEFLFSFTLLICISTYAQTKGTMTDPRDGQVYKTVEIGNQTWMAQNLNYESTDSIFYKKFIKPLSMLNQFGVYIPDSYCYGGVLINCEKYGRLYHYEAAMKACPIGWHLPDSSDYNSLLVHLNKAVGYDKYKLYQSLLPGGSSGFDIIFGGAGSSLTDNLRGHYGGRPDELYLWVSDTTKFTNSKNILTDVHSRNAVYLFFWLRRKSYVRCKYHVINKYWLFSVRCIKDEE